MTDITKGAVVGIMSDSHDDRGNIHRAVEVFNDAGCSLVIHAGDFVAPFTVREFKRLACPFIGVFGNNDGERKGLATLFSEIGSIEAAPREFGHGGRRFALMHEPFYLDDYAVRDDIDAVVYGHLHIIDIRPGHPLIINPGETCSWLTGRATVVLLDIATMDTAIIDL